MEIEGVKQLENFDILAESGSKYTPIDKVFELDVLDQELNIDFTAIVNKVKISGIEVLSIGEVSNDHSEILLHAVMDVNPYLVDYDGNGSEPAILEGTESHTHDPNQNLVQWDWYNNGTLIGSNEVFAATLYAGHNVLTLEIGDDKVPSETLEANYHLHMYDIDSVIGLATEYYPTTNPVALLDAVPTAASYTEFDKSAELALNNGSLGTSAFDTNVLVVRKGHFFTPSTSSYDFSVSGAEDMRLFVNGTLVNGPISLTAGSKNTLELRAARTAATDGDLTLELSIDGVSGGMAEQGKLLHDESNMLPVINDMPTTGSIFGGEEIVVEGLVFFEGDSSSQVKVHWGSAVLSGSDLAIEQNRITFEAPAHAEGAIQVKVETPNGMSLPMTYTYEVGLIPVKFKAITPITDAGGITQGTWGPDGRLYLGSFWGVIYAYEFDENYNVISTQTITAISTTDSPSILGIAFNPFDNSNEPKIYVSHNHLFANNNGKGFPDSEFSRYSGTISVIEGPNLDQMTPIITGLPVSNHDHAVNGIQFDDKGDLLVIVGGNTNAGVEWTTIGGIPESPLSGAVLSFPISKPGFNGHIEYEYNGTNPPEFFQVDSQVFGDIVDIKPSVDVEVYASGFRNGLDIVWTTSGILYGTDNGPNKNYGPESTGATTQDDVHPAAPDEFNLIIEGGYYGHPNRSRGRYDDRQNVYYGPFEASIPGVYSSPLTDVAPSTNGIVEYRATTFNEGIRGNILAQKFKGTLYNFSMNESGDAIDEFSTIAGLPGGLDVIVGPGGAILQIDYTANSVHVGIPDDPTAFQTRAYDIFPSRAPKAGGKKFVIGGVHFGDLANTTVKIGGVVAQISQVSEKRIVGIIPDLQAAADTLLDVEVTTNGNTVVIEDAFKAL